MNPRLARLSVTNRIPEFVLGTSRLLVEFDAFCTNDEKMSHASPFA